MEEAKWTDCYDCNFGKYKKGLLGGWINVKDRLPCRAADREQQREVVFYAKPYEWWTGLFTCKGRLSDKDKFEYHEHWGDDKYHEVEGVKFWMPLSKPPKGV